ncbi:MAG: metallophosphoesterase [Desulfovibrionaceae bacterium]|nr:metallophosphoesterase [Desulfovibrionaceae bacterium]
MMIHVLTGLIFVYALIRLILPSPLNGKIKLPAAVLLLLVSQQHALIRYAFGSMASPELPVPLLLVSGWSFASLLFLFLLLLVQDALLLLRRLIRGARKRANPPFSQGRRQAIVAAMAILPAAYGVRQGIVVPQVHHVEARLPRLPRELDGLTLVQISDLHVSPLLQEPRVRAVVDKVNALEPDLIIFTGDTVDGMPERRAGSVAPLQDLRARYGIFGCAGNHEYYGDYAAWMRTFPALGLTMLLNSHTVLKVRGTDLVVAGVTDMAAERFFLPGPDIGQALSGAPEDAVRILLDHRPGNAPENAKTGVDLQLSGHTHGGQILGMNQLVARFNQGFLYGWYQVDKMLLYVSSGAGLWNGFPVRLGVPSEIVRFVLRSAV